MADNMSWRQPETKMYRTYKTSGTSFASCWLLCRLGKVFFLFAAHLHVSVPSPSLPSSPSARFVCWQGRATRIGVVEGKHLILSETGPSTGLPGHSAVWGPTCLQNCSLCFVPQVYMFLVKWNDLSEKVVYRRFTEIYEFHVSPPGTRGPGGGEVEGG